MKQIQTTLRILLASKRYEMGVVLSLLKIELTGRRPSCRNVFAKDEGPIRIRIIADR